MRIRIKKIKKLKGEEWIVLFFIIALFGIMLYNLISIDGNLDFSTLKGITDLLKDLF